MKRLLLLIILFKGAGSYSQVNDKEIGAWYIAFFSVNPGQSAFGLQGDVQFRNWNQVGDLEQLLLRGGLTYTTRKRLKFTAGVAHITTGAYGLQQNKVSTEQRIYQELLYPHRLFRLLYIQHRMRSEQRFVQDQLFRTRYRYTLFLNVPLNKKEMQDKTLYLALYDEVFINGERNIGNGRTVDVFDRNRAYAAIGFQVNAHWKFQCGIMHQLSTYGKYQLQYSAHLNF